VSLFIAINKITAISVGADLSRTPPIHRPSVAFLLSILFLFHIINLDQKKGRRQEPIGGITKQPLKAEVDTEKSLMSLCRHDN